jgi:hypothetical protein
LESKSIRLTTSGVEQIGIEFDYGSMGFMLYAGSGSVSLSMSEFEELLKEATKLYESVSDHP